MANEVEVVISSKDNTDFSKPSASAKTYGNSLGKVGEKADASEQRVLGMKDTVDGVATIMQGPGKQGIAAYIQGWADLASGLGNFVFPALQASVTWLRASAVAAVRGAVQHTVSAARVVAAWVLMGVQSLLAAAKVAAAWLISMGPIALVIIAVVALVALIIKNWDTIKRVIGAGWNWVKDKTLGVWNGIKAFLSAAWRFIKTAVTAYFNAYKTIITTVWNTVKTAVTTVWNAIKNAIGAAMRWVKDKITTQMHNIRVGWSIVWNAIKTKLAEIWNGIKEKVRATIATVVGFVGGLKDKLVGKFKNAGAWLVGKGKDVLRGFLNGLKEIWKKITGWIGTLAGWIKDHKGPLSFDQELLKPAGKAIMNGFFSGLKHGGLKAFGFVKSIAGTIGGIFKGSGSLTDWVNQAVSITGVPRGWVGPLIARALFESGGNPNAVNNWDINAQRGTPSKGLMQTIGPTFAAYAMPGHNSIFNPVDNLIAAIRYILARYGSIYAIDPPVRGYKEGTDYVPQTGLAMLHKGEAVLTAAENRGRNGAGGTVVLEINSGGSRMDDMLVELLRKSIRSRGGDVQVALGSSR